MNQDKIIKQIEPNYYKIPLSKPLYDATHGRHTYFEIVIVPIKLKDGSDGIGYTFM